MTGDRDRFRGCLLGLACGDAVGTTVEFKRRGAFTPLTDMVGGGPFGLKPGQWTDDTSMALCLANSLTELGRFDAHDQMTRYLRWWQDGYCSATGSCFDIGGTTSSALSAFERTGDPFSGPTHDRSLGNGSIMRLAPVALFFYPDHAQAVTMAGESSRTTHGHPQCIDACRLLAAVLRSPVLIMERLEYPLAGWENSRCARTSRLLPTGSSRQSRARQIRGERQRADQTIQARSQASRVAR